MNEKKYAMEMLTVRIRKEKTAGGIRREEERATSSDLRKCRNGNYNNNKSGWYLFWKKHSLFGFHQLLRSFDMNDG